MNVPKKIKFIFLILIILPFTLLPVFAGSSRVLIYTSDEYLNNKKELDLVLFFPGQGCWSTFLLGPYDIGGLELTPPLTKYRSNILFASIDTNPQNHYGSPSVVSDILRIIRKLTNIYNIKHIYLIGGSMGASLTLNIASNSDNDIKNKISEILVYLPITDYEYTMKFTQNVSFKESLVEYFYKENKDPTLLKTYSPVTYVKDLPQRAKITIIAGAEDTTAPPQQVYEYFQKAKDFGKNIYLVNVKANHSTKEISKVFEAKLLKLLR